MRSKALAAALAFLLCCHCLPNRPSQEPGLRGFIAVDSLALMGAPPAKLSETGLFASVREMKPVPGWIPYSVNVPLWSDHGLKERAVAIPAPGQVVFREKDPWTFPIGTVFIKSFFLERKRGRPETKRRLETRLLVRNPQGWIGYTYAWDPEETEAFLLDGSRTDTYTIETEQGPQKQAWYFPSRNECMECHTKGAGFVLGVTTPQVNRVHTYDGKDENQLAAMARLGVFSAPLGAHPDKLDRFPDWDDPRAPVGRLARAYLDANCANCHNTREDIPPYLGHATPLEKTALLEERRLVPGNPGGSVLFKRVSMRGEDQMPPLATSLIDEKAVALLREWIRSLKPEK